MKNFKKLMSLFLAVLMLSSAMTGLSVMTVFADDETTGEESTGTPTEKVTIDHLYTEVFASPEAKLETMKKMYDNGSYQIYAHEQSGEVAVKDLASGQIIMTNPYDVGISTASDSVKNEILSQVIVKFEENGREKEFSSFEYAAMRDQIKIKNIKNGIRVEYTIGREEARHLVPQMIEKSRFESLIQAPLEEYYGLTYEEAKIYKDQPKHPLNSAAFYLNKAMCYFIYKDLDEQKSDRLRQDLLDAYPITERMDVYVLDTGIKTAEKERLEEIIKSACPNYTYEEMDYDHQLTEFTSEEENPPVFKLALEYTLDQDGFTVRLPANGIRFNEDKFQLTNISVLPYMGCGNNAYTGYNFFPDGAGALFAFEDLADENTYSVAGKIYGADYAYHKLSGTYQQTIRYPVFGIVENTKYYDCITLNDSTGEYETTRVSGLIYDTIMKAKETEGGTVPAALKKYETLLNSSDVEEVELDRGFVAIIEEGDALTELINYHAGALSPYDTVKMNFNPRPKDSYNVADAISVGSNSEWTVVSERKYVGNYKIHYVMLTDEEQAAENQLSSDSWYEPTWLGMAKAYRDYLTDPARGVLSPLSAEKTSGDLPLYIESFGAIETVEKILSIPVEVKRPLTSAKDVITMYEELSKAGATNINFKLTGFANGGILYSTVPYHLKWERAVTKETDMQELFDYAANLEEGNLGIYPDFDFSYVVETKMFDGFTSRKHAVRTIDDRVTYERKWMATQQKYSGMLKLAISPAYFHHFYEKLLKNYLKYDNVTGISVGTLGSALNSDFDEDEPYNREDSKQFIKDALEFISGSNDGNMSVMVDGGNSFTWEFVDHIVNAPLDSSRFLKASYSVPFLGVVLHGYMNFAGTPLNMEGDVNYAKLKAIENGASVYFTLSYQNTQILKEDENLSQYYSIRYDIWDDDVIAVYNELNDKLKDVQDKIIIDHQFLSGTRVSDIDELDRDIQEEFDFVLDYQTNKTEYEEKQKTQAVADARDKIASLKTTAQKVVKENIAFYSGMSGAAFLFVNGDGSFEIRYANYVEAKTAYDALLAEYEAADEAGKEAMKDELAAAESTYKSALGKLRTYIRNIGRAIGTIESAYDNMAQMLVDAEKGVALIQGIDGCPQSILDEINQQMAETETLLGEELGLTFNLTVDKAEVDTFLRTHIATLMASCGGKDDGKAENIYQLLASGEYGLLYSELDLLRYLDSNRDKTDAELVAKYGLSKDHASMDGLLLYITELLEDKYEFDPVVVDLKAHINDYFTYMLFETATGLKDAAILSTLNFVPTRINDKGREVPNTSNINRVTDDIKKKFKAVLGKDALVASVTDGKYGLEDVMKAGLLTEDQYNTLIDECVAIINNNIRTETNTSVAADKAVEYKTPDTMRADVERLAVSYYYQQVISTIASTEKVSLLVSTVNSKTDASIDMLVSMKRAEYTAAGATTYEALYKAMLDDLANGDLGATLDRINDSVKGAYGDVRAELEKAFIRGFLASVLGSDKVPTFSTTTREVPKLDENGDPVYNDKNEQEMVKIKLSDEVKAYLADKTFAGKSVAELDQMVSDIVKIHETEGYAADKFKYDAKERSSDYVYFQFLTETHASMTETTSYYYDSDMATMDATVRAKVKETHDQIVASLGADASDYDVYAAILNSLDGNTTAFVEGVVAKISHVPQDKYSLKDDVLSYYTYLLFDSFKENKLTDDAMPEIHFGTDVTSQKYKNALTVLNDFLSKDDKKNNVNSVVTELLTLAKTRAGRGNTPNYSIDEFLTEEELSAYVYKMGDVLGRNRYYNIKDPNDKDAIKAETDKCFDDLKAYLLHTYYMAVAERLKVDADTAPAFHVSDVYASTLQLATMELKELMYYYVSYATGMTYDEIDKLIGGAGSGLGNEEDEEEESSRYLSNDGRIVSVTYGDKNADGSYSAYKTFILNYNNFSVSVKYNGSTYAIPAYGYVIV